MNEQKPSIADRIETDIQNAVNAMIDASRITQVRFAMQREHRREFVMQEAELEARLLEYEGHAELADQLRRVVEGLRGLTPKVVANGQGDLR